MEEANCSRLIRSIITGEWEYSFSFNAGTTVLFSHDGRLIWGTKKTGGVEECVAVDSFYGTETSPVALNSSFIPKSVLKYRRFEGDCFLQFAPITNDRGCLLQCVPQAGLRLSLVQVDFQRAEFVPLDEEFDVHPLPQLSHIPRVMTSGRHLAVEITAIDVQLGRDETPRLFLFEVGHKIKPLGSFPLVYGNASSIHVEGRNLHYFPQDSSFHDLAEIDLDKESSKLIPTTGFPFAIDELKDLGSNSVWGDRMCFVVVGSRAAIFSLDSAVWLTIELSPDFNVDRLNRPLISLDGRGILSVHVHKEGSKHRRRTHRFKIEDAGVCEWTISR
ncbi:hypothetical protein M3Y99_01475300 [Aphelenchoides fujianensis]|nr:hypothetical protein M3Y99_01475300 [Aphelenchoides fujianensis]